MLLRNKCIGVAVGITVCLSCFAGDTSEESLSEVRLATRIDSILKEKSDIFYGEFLAAQCASCHSKNENTGAIPIIHGQSKLDLTQALLEYQNELRTNAIMQSIAGALSDEDIGALALYFSKQ